jgi:hypothetical protein
MTTEKTQEGKMDMQAAMEVYQRLATPGEPHRLLARLEGTWDAKMKCWMEPDQPPAESTGRSEYRVVFGGRFLQHEFAGEMMGSPFQGFGVIGYDNHEQKYVSTWMDSMGTSLLYFEGTGSADGKAVIQECRHDDPIRGPVTWRSVTRFVDENTHAFEMYSTCEGGKEEKIMEIAYGRRR